ncbi:hypothetical protein BJV85_002758 [Clostridium acetobutylicum]|uniref:Predicted membrane protein n=1 Tax=Clostridium acetobutylicum (strain ATCC 824 / DSM 792 / JCM 1419 / IAM 19013 / LMG 5710 / NBRC 13948 / NRRL B-527 / VKM B-1787 / 2291 / W) TaxID=272562 RepID=Q97JN4_CLOAB|nr:MULTISPECIES: DUF4321 domain-containing protein [Clostridium]AAK79211.1 Predicted membrane protein [Clostridium acetobutylicum ATCC 824]ADZ20290.1 membrane protein [Clostridium acetobutylicum EA 2018]AEI31733.1 hypothetical protein SMB_G1260 [Clostridium acetobutylicum DSM 1731]AWV81540.1 DUF4321 domain-containing protein [Clostridium acetobutylicum]KHD35113.1 membrane protein [Clostridium acetobutylicum]
MNGKTFKNVLFLSLIGCVGGSLVGDILGEHFTKIDFLKKAYSIGTVKPLVIDLKVLNFTLGLNFNVNLMSILGIIVAIIIYSKIRK